MGLRRVCLIGIAVCLTGPAYAQDAAPPEPAAAAPTSSTPTPAAAQPVPATPAAPPANAAAVKTDAAQPETASATAPSDSLPEGKLDADKIMAAQKAGYQIRNENGQTLLCRRDPKTGSRLRYTTSCLTAAEWEQLQSDTAQTLRATQRRRVSPNSN